MIKIEEDCEFITMIADVIKLIGNLEKFKLKIWVSGCESPFEYTEEDGFLFLNEGMRIYHTHEFHHIGTLKRWSYIFYDNIVNIQVVVKHEY